jgi:pimeloyl-ACP methyl ester carboxylesterase
MRTGGPLVVALWLVGACGSKASSPPIVPPPEPGSAAQPVPPVEPPRPAVVATERWAASIAAGPRIIDFVVAFEGSNGAWTAKLEGVTKDPLPLAAVTLTADRIAFTLEKPANPAANEIYELKRTGDVADGTSTIGPAQIPARMVKLAGGDAPRSAYERPQTPKGPFPYVTREVEIAASDGGTLAGTITLPAQRAPGGAVLLWSGSGQQDRDENIYGHRPFFIIADRLTRAGFVTLRLDDRGTGRTKGAVGSLYTEIDDAGAAIDWLKTQKEVDPKKVGMIGHSTGGMVVPNVALKHPLAFAVLLAGVAIPGRELVLLQQEIAAEKAGVKVPAEARELQRALGEAAAKNPADVKRILVEAVTKQYRGATGRAPTPEELEAAIAKPLAEVTNPWTISYFKIDPRDAWKKLKVPTLLVIGDLDTQVPAEVTVRALGKAFGKRVLLQTKTIPGLNHLFQHAKTGLPDEYIRIDESFDPGTLDAITTWVTERTK